MLHDQDKMVTVPVCSKGFQGGEESRNLMRFCDRTTAPLSSKGSEMPCGSAGSLGLTSSHSKKQQNQDVQKRLKFGNFG